ncbi:Predicted amidohydrolase [Thermanaeromonas toyohensis ToBE]|uniref:Predicted amidohydrolase n=1 Tax=Thermanaeromonas toyohensis ToBE TaxID=698762 RepID=A0A1W1VA54_9FIRM|nr:carbon-nitrogen hydrolase family protein [Thermanaeromonas toyohensis]SMB89921.1 Predicted amidohydrolase [Thermanaeromonas toyohensis ToBE]
MRVAVVQMFIADSLKVNLSRILALAREAARRGAKLVVFPEMCLTGYSSKVLKSPRLEEELKEALAILSRWSVKLDLSLVVGRAEVSEGKYYNAASVFLPDGRVHTYYKIYLTEAEARYFSPGKTPLVFEYYGHRFGIIICRDQNYPELAQRLRQEGAEALLILSAHFYSPPEARWKMDKNLALPIARAVENAFPVFLANAVGSHIGLISLGNSLIVDPQGVVVARAGETGEEILTWDPFPHSNSP